MRKNNRLILAFKNALNGARTAYRTQQNLRIQVYIGILVFGFAVLLKISLVELLIILLAIVS
ncbi:MAG: diacylglycerol kinase family protein, partial [Caldisericaceae bacterium]|nr:diacylglycerol kinase family protein [Caldisericaceae bacterium]